MLQPITAGNVKGTSAYSFYLNVTALAKPSISGFAAAKVTAGNSYRFAPASSNATSFDIANLPGWATFDTGSGTLQGTPTTNDVGSYQGIVITAHNAAGSTTLAAFAITVVPPLPTISGTPPKKVTSGTEFSFTPTATNATSFSIANKPAWASFNTVKGILTGTPTAVGSYGNIIIRAINSSGSVALPSFPISVVPPMPTISGTPALTATTGRAYSFTPKATNATSFSIAKKPSWATFNPGNGSLYGTPPGSAVGSFADITISATNSTATAI